MALESKVLPHPVDPEANQVYEGGLPHEKNWVDFATYCFHDYGELFGYMEATTDITKHLQILIENSAQQNLEEFRHNLSQFCLQRCSFVEHIKEIPSPGDVWS